jgi:hypothetical protein
MAQSVTSPRCEFGGDFNTAAISRVNKNSKHEIRNSKQIQNPKFKCFKWV